MQADELTEKMKRLVELLSELLFVAKSKDYFLPSYGVTWICSPPLEHDSEYEILLREIGTLSNLFYDTPSGAPNHLAQNILKEYGYRVVDFEYDGGTCDSLTIIFPTGESLLVIKTT